MYKIILFPISVLYALIASFRNFLYDHNFLKSYYFHKTSIISIGNLSVGGTGKTPMTEYILSSFNKNKIAVLSRGYKRTTKGFLLVNPNNSPIEVGDEPLQMAQKFPNKTIAVCEERIVGIKELISKNNIEAILLDDAFQHRKVKPKLSILLTEYNRPYFKDHFLPAGKLRDNKSESHRADIIVVTKSPNKLLPIEKNIWRANLKIRPYQKMFFTTIQYGKIINIFDSNVKKQQNTFKDYHILIFTGIANHKYFTDHIKNNVSKKVKTINFIDHKNYSLKNIEDIIIKFNEIKSKNKIILTTEKDAVKIRNIKINEKFKEYFFYHEIKTKFLFNKEEEFNKLIKNTLS